ncbi:hypothetical protein HDA32_005729 [Spinactinospora alkalitolerans]|uniref:Uncharacterized protein n=1 Tax=Spinactinospora alkalitolerans TaxID=687207 RepID=A0A852U333_9ACTN|nr:hypothetical protein [Spinactinospora alkalitolerans]NYE50609.1 hypothetical protein [Spinactinospora alkalitolerans]
MTADERPDQGENQRTAERLRDALFAADLKRLVQASQEDDDESVAEIRRNYAIE